MENKNNQQQAEEKNQNTRQENTGNKQQANDPLKPQDRLKDGTNDFQNGDQDYSSEKSEKPSR